jgi:hypothetical protein
MTKIFSYCPKCGLTMETRSLVIFNYGIKVECEKGHNTIVNYEQKELLRK